MNRADIYHSHPGILGGTPVFTGTRVPVDSLVHHLRTGVTLEDFLDDLPEREPRAGRGVPRARAQRRARPHAADAEPLLMRELLDENVPRK